MGIHIDTLDFFWETLHCINYLNLRGTWILELGNQTIRMDTRKKYRLRSGKSKVYFLGMRCNHHAIDWNGLDGAVPVDITNPIPIERFINAFDIVTDFGSMEHLSGYTRGDLPIDKAAIKYDSNTAKTNQWQAWKNIHDMGKISCVYIHTVPLLGSNRGHGYFHYTLKFFDDLCKANNYIPIISRIEQHDPRHHRRDYVFCSYVKREDKPFVPELEEFKEWLYR